MQDLFSSIDSMKEFVVDTQRELVAIPAVGPMNDGDGEVAKAKRLLGILAELGIEDVARYDAPDPSVSDGVRPNLVVRIPGHDTSRTMWIIAHIDVVPPGDLSLWNSDPYELVRDGDRIIGRGVEDNHQGMVSSLCLAKGLLDNGITPPINLGLMFVADEETGNAFGLDYLLENHFELFGAEDLFLVPDFGDASSEVIEVAEKSAFWFRFAVEGEQCHASTPDQGNNSLVACSDLILRLQALNDVFDDRDELFSPPVSTFVPTKKEANVENVNTLPGRDVFYLDARVLPQYPLESVQKEIGIHCREIEKRYGVTVSCDAVMAEQAAPPTPADAEIVERISKAVLAIYGKKARVAGVGGGTVAAGLRRKGLHAVVWATLSHQAHQPNEWASIAATIGDAKVMAHALMAGKS